MIDKEYPLFPHLPEEAQKEAGDLLDVFRDHLKKVADEVIGDLYVDALPYIESDAWQNFRNEIMDGFKGYDNRKVQSEYDFKEIRQAILKHHREDIIDDLNQDMVKEIADLKEHIEFMERSRY